MSSTLSEQVAELEAERDELKERDKDPRIQAWNEIADHPFFEGAYDTEGTLLGAMLARLDAAMEPAHATDPRVITIDELKSWQCVAVGHNGHWRIIEMGDHIEEMDRAETLDYFAIYPGDTIVLLEDTPAEEPEPVKMGDTISTDQLEQAAEAAYASTGSPIAWDVVSKPQRQTYRKQARAALEAAGMMIEE